MSNPSPEAEQKLIKEGKKWGLLAIGLTGLAFLELAVGPWAFAKYVLDNPNLEQNAPQILQAGLLILGVLFVTGQLARIKFEKIDDKISD